jgi:uncharacterized protein YdhG (YjbR/CyaY superfamily)
MTESVNEYVNNYEGEKKEWLVTFITYMRENFPDISEVISYQIPTYKFNHTYIAFSIAKEHFTFHTLDFEMIEELKTLLPRAKFGKGSAKVKFDDHDSIPILKKMIHKIVKRKMEKHVDHKDHQEVR